MLQGLDALAADPRTRVVVLISKPPAPAIARRIEEAAAVAGKPVVVHFLGERPRTAAAGLFVAGALREAADLAVALARGEAPPSAEPGPSAAALADVEARRAAMAPGQKSVRALFTGGTFCYEAQLAFIARGLACRSNAPAAGALPFDGRYAGHVFLDLGDDEYTRGRPHPMIDPTLRDAAVLAQAADPEVAAIVFDVVLGYGSHADPAGGLARALADAQRIAGADGRTLALIGHVCGTDGDPQDKAAQLRRLQDAGALIADSNIEAARLAAHLAAGRA
jgi:FdrA protein